MTAVSAQSGTHKPEQVFCLAHVADDQDVEEDDPLRGLLLQLSTWEYIEPAGSIYLPLQPERFGTLKMYTTDSFAEYLLDMPATTDPSHEPLEIHISVLLFEDLLPSVVKITGTDLAVGDLKSADSALVRAADQDVLRDGGDDVNVGVDVVGVSSSSSNAGCDHDHSHEPAQELDLMSFLESDQGVFEPPKKRQRKKTQTIQKSDDQDVENEKGKNGLVLDSCLASFLEPHEIEAFRDIQNLCREVHASDDIFEKRAREKPDDMISDSDGEVDAVFAEDAAPSAASSSEIPVCARETGYFA